jgi:hypothetical protein
MIRSHRGPCLVLVCLLFLLTASCTSDDSGVIDTTIEGSGIIVSQDRTVATFHSVNVLGVAVVLITQGPSQSVEIETDSNIIDHIDTSVLNGVLNISSDVEYSTSHGVIVFLEMAEVRRIDVTGVGTIVGQNDFTSDDLIVNLAGVGNITVSGTADSLVATLTGVGNIDAEDLEVDTCTVVISGIGDCRVHATQELSATISGSGNVYYAGNPPSVSSTITGAGNLIPI